jgi:hypothetical protein
MADKFIKRRDHNLEYKIICGAQEQLPKANQMQRHKNITRETIKTVSWASDLKLVSKN